MDYEDITGFVAYDYDGKWWVLFVLSTEEERHTEDNVPTSYWAITITHVTYKTRYPASSYAGYFDES
jgi:hypothetical protein